MSNRSSPSPGRQSFWPRDGDFVRLTSWSPGNVPRGMWGVRLESGQAQSGPQHEMPHNEKCHPKHGISSSDGPSANCRAAIAAKSIIPPLFSFESSGGSPTDQVQRQGNGKGTSDTERASCFTQAFRERRNRCASRSLRFPPAVSGSGGCLPKGKFRCWFPDSRRRLPLCARPARPVASLQCAM